jgi:hypothetical protein
MGCAGGQRGRGADGDVRPGRSGGARRGDEKRRQPQAAEDEADRAADEGGRERGRAG